MPVAVICSRCKCNSGGQSALDSCTGTSYVYVYLGFTGLCVSSYFDLRQHLEHPIHKLCGLNYETLPGSACHVDEPKNQPCLSGAEQGSSVILHGDM